MCGRYILAQQKKAERDFDLGRIRWEFEVSYNVAPTQKVPVVRFAAGEREGLMMRWGLVPFFAHGKPLAASTINARAESLAMTPSYRGAWQRGQRCILIAAGFYEWHLSAEGIKQPFFISLADREVFGFAGLWDRSLAPDGTATESCTIVTMAANALLADIHNVKQRMPAILRTEDHEVWLRGSANQAAALLVPYPADLMVAYRVSTRVNSPKNNDASLIEPVG